MRGKHHIRISTGHLRYEFDIKRNITIVQGDSATGKTTLIGLLSDYSRRGDESGVQLQSDVPCRVFNGSEADWKLYIDTIKNEILFFDEDYGFIFSKDFAEAIRDSYNYYVFITRRPLKNLPYSINEIYGIRTSGKYHFPEQVYHEFYNIYDADAFCQRMDSKILLIEDSNAGFEFFSRASKEGVTCISAKGNAKVFSEVLKNYGKGSLTIIADGAAFGAYIESIMELSHLLKEGSSMYFPESFEWLILKSNVLEDKGINEILEHPYDYVESEKFFSWERFFNAELVKRSSNSYLKYNKAMLNEGYLSPKISQQIISVMPKELKELF